MGRRTVLLDLAALRGQEVIAQQPNRAAVNVDWRWRSTILEIGPLVVEAFKSGFWIVPLLKVDQFASDLLAQRPVACGKSGKP